MKIVQGDEVPFEERKHQHRQGTFRFRRLLEGEPGSPGNFYFSMVRTIDDFYSPRHRHNFDQFRFQLEGTFDFSQNGKMKPGTVGYFPEATPYGPQTSSESSLTAVLQFGGASGSGYMSEREMQAGTAELKKSGVFEAGVYRRPEGAPGPRNMDGYQAVWEFVNRRPMVYPEPRYHEPIMMEPEHFAWLPVEGEAGVSEKLLGVFTERRTEAAFLRLEPGAAHRASGRGIYLVVTGRGRVAGEPFRAYTTVFLERGETAVFSSEEASELLVLALPRVDGPAAPAAARERREPAGQPVS
jgi:hypothetical protein